MEKLDRPKQINNEEVIVLVELIRNSEKNSNSRLDSVSQRLDDYIDDHKERFNEIKGMIKDMGTKIDDFTADIHDRAIRPINDQLQVHHDRIRDTQESQRTCVKVSDCQVKENELKECCWNNMKKLIYMNAGFMIVYTVILANSNISINWEMVKNILKLFTD